MLFALFADRKAIRKDTSRRLGCSEQFLTDDCHVVGASGACQQQRALGGLHEAPLAGHGPSRQAEGAE